MRKLATLARIDDNEIASPKGNESMIYRGAVKHGVVELEKGATLPDGTRVNIEPLALQEQPDGRNDNALFAMSDLAVDTGIEDLATNIDHYLYGHPKVSSDG